MKQLGLRLFSFLEVRIEIGGSNGVAVNDGDTPIVDRAHASIINITRALIINGAYNTGKGCFRAFVVGVFMYNAKYNEQL